MTGFAIVTGLLFKPPEQRTSKAGRPYVTATIRFKDGEALQWWRVTAFSETTQTELMRLGEGDALSIQGALKAELYRPDGGEPKVSLSIVADHILPLRQPSKRGPKSPEARDTRTRQEHCAPGDQFDDEIPFGGEP